VAIEPEAVVGDPGQDRSAWPARGPIGFSPDLPGIGRAAGHRASRSARGSRGARSRSARGSRGLALTVALAGVAGLIVAASQVYAGLTPRQFTQAQQQQIMAWEVAARWRELPAGVIFPATATYPPPSALQDGGALTLAARRLGIARGVPCKQAADPAVAAILDASQCRGLLRATYEDQTGSFLVTVGIAAFPGAAQAGKANEALTAPSFTHAGHPDVLTPGVRTATFTSTAAATFGDPLRQVSGSTRDGPYIALYTIGYADGRPKVPVDVDGYTYAEMTSMGQGLARSIVRKLTLPPPAPRCPGAPGC
jgi:hypothetical protein